MGDFVLSRRVKSIRWVDDLGQRCSMSDFGIYLDHNATTPLDPLVLEEMMPALTGAFGNPSSIHGWGQGASRIVELARERTAWAIGAEPEEIIFTSGGTEADNLAVVGAFLARRQTRTKVVVSAVEHQAVLGPAGLVEELGGTLELAPVDKNGVVDLASLKKIVDERTAVVSVMAANNDVGAIQPVREVGSIARDAGAWFHCDAVQALGKIPVDVDDLNVDLLTISGHKIYGPKGVGALYMRRGVLINAVTRGGHQERELRAGTHNTAAIAGLGKACEIATARLERDLQTLAELRKLFESELRGRLAGVEVVAEDVARLPGTSCILVDGVEGESVMIALDLSGIAVSTGAACRTSSRDPSHVLVAMGYEPHRAHSALRVTFGRSNTAEQALRAAQRLVAIVEKMRATEPLRQPDHRGAL